LNRYQGRRFAGFLISMAALCVGAATVDPESFPTFASTIGVLYGAYLAGQSATDFQKLKNGSK